MCACRWILWNFIDFIDVEKSKLLPKIQIRFKLTPLTVLSNKIKTKTADIAAMTFHIFFSFQEWDQSFWSNEIKDWFKQFWIYFGQFNQNLYLAHNNCQMQSLYYKNLISNRIFMLKKAVNHCHFIFHFLFDNFFFFYDNSAKDTIAFLFWFYLNSNNEIRIWFTMHGKLELEL